MRLKPFLKAMRSKIVRQDLGPQGDTVPDQYIACFCNIGGALEQIHVVSRLLGRTSRPLRILNVGVFGGRDFWAMRLAGHDVTGLDLEAVADCPPTIKGDAEADWPFPDHSFDVVIMGEILEHLFFDRDALQEANRVLKPDGILVGSVPFLHDSEDYHVRIHSPQTIVRLLHASGFEVLDFVERPALMPWTSINPLNQALALIYYLLTRKSLYPTLARLYGNIEWTMGHCGWLPRRYLRTLNLINWGATFKARPSAISLDYKEVNRREFTSTACDSGNPVGMGTSGSRASRMGAHTHPRPPLRVD